MMIEEAEIIYTQKYGELPSTFQLEPEDRAWIDEQLKMAAMGERGEITEAEINKKFNIASRTKTQII